MTTNNDKTDAKIIELYTEDGLTQRDVAMRCRVSIKRVVATLRARGVKPNLTRRFYTTGQGGVW